MKLKSIFVFLCFFVFSLPAITNKSVIDSLRLALKASPNDTTSINLLNKLILESRKINPEQALNYSDIALKLCKKADYKKGEGQTYLMIGAVYFDYPNYPKALEYYNKSLELRESLDDKRGVAQSLNNIGDTYVSQGAYQKALKAYLRAIDIARILGEKDLMKFNNIAAAYYYLGDYPNAQTNYLAAIKLFEEQGKKEKMIHPSLGVGNVYNAMKNYGKALTYYEKALDLSTEVGNKSRIALCLNNIGSVYLSLHNNDTALSYYLKSLKINEELIEKQSVALSLMNVGNVYANKKNFEKAQQYYEQGLKTYTEVYNNDGISKSLLNLGNLYYDKGDMENAIKNLVKGLVIADSIKNKELLMMGNEKLSDAYFKKGDYKNAHAFYRKYAAIKDSLLSEVNTKNITEINTKYETEKKESEIELLTKDKDIQNEKIKNQENVRNGLVVGCFLLLLIIFLAYNRYRVKQRASKEIAEKNKEITESISYAKRIQTSFLTSENYIAQKLSDYFILYKPRNIVSGDFYWFMEKENSLYICTADCTGHGIPGAFMSLICMGILNEIIYSKNHIEHTDDMLNELRRIIILAVNPEGATEEGKDGMDAVLCRFDFNKMEVEYSAANNSFYIIRNGELFVHKPDKMPVGKHYGPEKPFTRNTIPIQKGDCIYSFSDGFADQFGGPEDKKFQTKQLKELLLSHCHKPMKIQQRIFNDTIEAWKGNLEQVDDILLIGIRV